MSSKYIGMAIGSALETVSLLKFAKQRGYINEASMIEFYEKAERLIRKSRAFQRTLQEAVPAVDALR